MVRTEQLDTVAILHLEHGSANTFDVEFCSRAVEELEKHRDSQTRAIILTGRRNIFSAGVDLLRLVEEGPDYARDLLEVFHDFCSQVFVFPKPIVAAINGHAIAGGCVLACMADWRLMVQESGRIGVPELLVGVPFPAAPLEVMRFAVPPQHLQEVIYFGNTYDPEEALARGLVDRLVPEQDLQTRALEDARLLASLPETTFRLTKIQLREPVVERMRIGHERHGPEVVEAWTDPAIRTAVEDYVEKTLKPG
jgi:enoyl-CoA hydratase